MAFTATERYESGNGQVSRQSQDELNYIVEGDPAPTDAGDPMGTLIQKLCKLAGAELGRDGAARVLEGCNIMPVPDAARLVVVTKGHRPIAVDFAGDVPRITATTAAGIASRVPTLAAALSVARIGRPLN